MQPGDRLICAFPKPMETNQEFTSWPLHVTIVPWFRTEINSKQFAKELENKLKDIPAFDVLMGKQMRFGFKKRANLVKLPSPFISIEAIVRGFLKNHHAWLVDESTKRKYQYRPHVTAQAHEHLEKGDTFACDRIYVVAQHGSHKTIEAEIRLG